MKRRVFFLLIFAFLPLLFSACTAGYTLKVNPDSISPTGLVLTVRRTAIPGNCTFGEDFTIDQKTDAGWEPVPVLDPDMNYCFVSIGYELFPGLWKTMPIDWSYIYGELPPGRYRIGKGVSAGKERPDVTVWAEFEIKE